MDKFVLDFSGLGCTSSTGEILKKMFNQFSGSINGNVEIVLPTDESKAKLTYCMIEGSNLPKRAKNITYVNNDSSWTC